MRALTALLILAATSAQTTAKPTREQLQQLAHLSELAELLLRTEPGTQAANIAKGEVAFTKLGETSYRTEYITIKLAIDTDKFESDMRAVKDASLKLRQWGTTDEQFSHTLATHTLDAAETIIAIIEARKEQLDQLTKPWSEPWHKIPSYRRKRGFFGDLVSNVVSEIPFGRLAWWGLKTIASTAFGWWTAAEVGKARSDAETNGREIKKLQHDTNMLADRAQAADNIVQQLVRSTYNIQRGFLAQNAATSINIFAISMKAHWDAHEAIIEAALDHRLSPKALMGRDMSDVKLMVSEAAIERNLEIPINSLADFLQCKTSFISSQQGLDLIVHVPAAPRDSLMEVYRYVPLPIPLKGGAKATPRLTKDILAIAHDNAFFATLSSTDLLQCKQQGHLFHCPNLNIVRKPDEQEQSSYMIDEGLCLYHLFSHDLEAALKVCPLTLADQPSEIRRVAKGNFMAFVDEDEVGIILCGSSETRQEFILRADSPTNITLGPGCKAVTDKHMFANPSDGRAAEWEKTNVFATAEINIPDILNNTSVQELQEAAVQWIGARTEISLEQARFMTKAFDEEESRLKRSLVLYTTATITCILVLIIIAAGAGFFIQRRTCRRKQTDTKTKKPTYASLRADFAELKRAMEQENCNPSAPPYPV